MRFRPRLTITLVLAFCVSAFAQALDPLEIFDRDKRWYNGFTEAWFQFFDIPEADVRRSIEKWQEISKGGSLYASGGETHGTYLMWSIEKGFMRLDVDKCQGGPMKITSGRVEKTPGGVAFITEHTLGGSTVHSDHASQPKRVEYVSIDWAGSNYLVWKSLLSEFADYTAGLGDYNTNYAYMEGDDFLRSGGSEKVAPGEKIPRYPAGYEKIHKRPVRGSIVSVGKARRVIDKESEYDDKLITPITIKLESGENFKPGLYMHLADVESEDMPDEFTLRSKHGNLAVVEHIASIPKKNCIPSEYYDCKPPARPQLRKGQVLSTNGL